MSSTVAFEVTQVDRAGSTPEGSEDESCSTPLPGQIMMGEETESDSPGSISSHEWSQERKALHRPPKRKCTQQAERSIRRHYEEESVALQLITGFTDDDIIGCKKSGDKYLEDGKRCNDERKAANEFRAAFKEYTKGIELVNDIIRKDHLATDDKKTNDAIASLYEGRAKASALLYGNKRGVKDKREARRWRSAVTNETMKVKRRLLQPDSPGSAATPDLSRPLAVDGLCSSPVGQQEVEESVHASSLPTGGRIPDEVTVASRQYAFTLERDNCQPLQTLNGLEPLQVEQEDVTGNNEALLELTDSASSDERKEEAWLSADWDAGSVGEECGVKDTLPAALDDSSAVPVVQEEVAESHGVQKEDVCPDGVDDGFSETIDRITREPVPSDGEHGDRQVSPAPTRSNPMPSQLEQMSPPVEGADLNSFNDGSSVAASSGGFVRVDNSVEQVVTLRHTEEKPIAMPVLETRSEKMPLAYLEELRSCDPASTVGRPQGPSDPRLCVSHYLDTVVPTDRKIDEKLDVDLGNSLVSAEEKNAQIGRDDIETSDSAWFDPPSFEPLDTSSSDRDNTRSSSDNNPSLAPRVPVVQPIPPNYPPPPPRTRPLGGDCGKTPHGHASFNSSRRSGSKERQSERRRPYRHASWHTSRFSGSRERRSESQPPRRGRERCSSSLPRSVHSNSDEIHFGGRSQGPRRGVNNASSAQVQPGVQPQSFGEAGHTGGLLVLLDLDHTLVYYDKMTKKIYLRPGCEMFLDALKGNGLTIGVYSAAAQQQVDDYLLELDPDERTITRGHVYTVPRDSSGRVKVGEDGRCLKKSLEAKWLPPDRVVIVDDNPASWELSARNNVVEIDKWEGPSVCSDNTALLKVYKRLLGLIKATRTRSVDVRQFLLDDLVRTGNMM